MGRYGKLGTLAIRWTAVGFFILAVVFLSFGVAGGSMMSAVMMGAQVSGAGTQVPMHTSTTIWWGPALLNVAMGSLLFVLSKPIGSILGAGLDD